MFDFSIVTQWFDQLLRVTLGLGDFWSILIECVLVGVIILAGLCAYRHGSYFYGT